MTLTDKRALEAELAEMAEKKKAVAEEIKVARGFGDLSENAEYDAAKKEEARVYGRIAELEEMLANSIFEDDTQASTDAVAVGTVVTTEDLDEGFEEEYTIVGFTETNPDLLYVSQESPIGAAMMGAKIGQVVEFKAPGGAVIRLKIKSIRRR
jgi:transcription elongation factor GreA